MCCAGWYERRALGFKIEAASIAGCVFTWISVQSSTHSKLYYIHNLFTVCRHSLTQLGNSTVFCATSACSRLLCLQAPTYQQCANV